jgi:hypothetical protein
VGDVKWGMEELENIEPWFAAYFALGNHCVNPGLCINAHSVGERPAVE